MVSWDVLEKACHSCHKCEIGQTRKNVVIGRGNREANLMLIGEGPGAQEDLKGLPFVGPAGQLLDKMLGAAGFTEQDVYIANIVKCRPPNNRDPNQTEKDNCINYLRYQVKLVSPKIIVCLGRVAAQTIISPTFRITKERGEWFDRKGYAMMATYHPSALLRDETKKRPAWEDFQELKKRYDVL